MDVKIPTKVIEEDDVVQRSKKGAQEKETAFRETNLYPQSPILGSKNLQWGTRYFS
jgi:hypothetical protein